MADPNEVAWRDGAHRTNKVTIEPGATLDLGYTCMVLENEIGATGRLKVLVQPVEFPGHHSTNLGDRRFGVEIRDPDAVTKCRAALSPRRRREGLLLLRAQVDDLLARVDRR